MMKPRTLGLVVVGVLVAGFAAGGSPHNVTALVAGGTEMMLGPWTPGEGAIGPGARIRNWTAQYQDAVVGPAADLASASGPVTMNCNLDATLTGPCWGTFEFENATGTWLGTWLGTFNFATGAGSYRGFGRGHGGLKGMELEIDAVYPGWAFAGPNGPVGYIYSTVRKSGR